MRKFFPVVLILFCTTTILKAQGDSYDGKASNLEWREYRKLSWEDFQGKPGENAAGDAGTSVQIKAKPYLIKNKVRYDVSVFFNKDKSWKRDQSPELLAHEQLHFDLAEVFARKIRKKITELNKQDVSNVKAYNQAIQQLLEESNEADRQYDIETLHGALDQKQAEWAEKIKRELVALKAYKKPKQVISAR